MKQHGWTTRILLATIGTGPISRIDGTAPIGLLLDGLLLWFVDQRHDVLGRVEAVPFPKKFFVQ